MWGPLARFILQFRWLLLCLLLAVTGFMTWHAIKVQLSYEFTRAIPTDNPKYQAYQAFRQQFGEDGNLLVIGVQTDQLFTEKLFNAYIQLAADMKKVEAVEDVLSVPAATNLLRDAAAEKLNASPYFLPAICRRPQSTPVPPYFAVYLFTRDYCTTPLPIPG
ncbi:hypothetical protein [Paraflavitalea speifideaquila]|uniref:hypothetical protein n=1 Tax=Paraflavitalea speifideaquila TaxID=3076558 RepID=UPI0028E4CFCB|nr:hypothetical protein [Paraflavitalea speifideiaquila]